MEINQIEKDASVEVIIALGEKCMTFHTVAVGGMPDPQKALVVEPIFNEGKIVNFKGANYTIEALVTTGTDAKPWSWKPVIVTTMKNQEGKFFHVILADKPGKTVNRRSHYRLFMGVDATIQLNLDKQLYNVLLKDISATGFSIVCPGDMNLNMGTTVTIAFIDAEEDVKFVLTASVVRRETAENSDNGIYGCRLKNINPMVQKYVNDKQMKRSRHIKNAPLKPKRHDSAAEKSSEKIAEKTAE